MQPEATRRNFLQTLTAGGVTVALSGCGTNFSFMGDRDGTQTDTPMQSPRQQVGGERQKPVKNGRFKVEISDIEVTGFQHVTIPGSTTENNGQTTFEDLVMERIVLKGDSTLRDWRDEMRQGKVESARRTVSVTLLTEEGQPVIEWRFTNAWVKEYDPPKLVASGTEVATESCTVTYDEMIREEP